MPQTFSSERAYARSMRLPFLCVAALSLVACGGNTAEPPPSVPIAAHPVDVPPPPVVQTTSAAPPANNDKKACDDSRSKRVSDDKDMITARVTKALLYKGAGKQIRSSCKITGDKAFAPVERSGTGWNVSQEQRDSVKCTGGLPGGVTKDDAYVLLASEKNGEKAFTSGPVLAPEEHATDDAKCTTYDKAAGLDLFTPQYGDEASVKKVLDWKAP